MLCTVAPCWLVCDESTLPKYLLLLLLVWLLPEDVKENWWLSLKTDKERNEWTK